MTIVIMAAGMGSRFGGLKQIEPVGPNGEFIIDYSIYDAIKAGFDKVVFIIKEENYDIFKETIGKRIEGKIQVEYVFQKNDITEYGVSNVVREKPFGTGHAILCTKDIVKEPFIVINADDFYGRDGYIKSMEFIKNNKNDNNYDLVAYSLFNTLTTSGSVKRGICEINNNELVSLNESSCIMTDNGILVSPLNGDEPFYVSNDTPVSMNLFVFYPTLYKYLEDDFKKFLQDTKDITKDEFFLPTVVCDHIKLNDVTCGVIENSAVWKGVTYASDLDELKEFINSEIEKGVYPKNLYKEEC